MEVIKHEIFSQTEALLKTEELLLLRQDELYQYLHQPFRSFVFLGCGSGHMLNKSAAALFSLYTDKKAIAIAGGEVLMNPENYKNIFSDSLVIITSRSGETSEVIFALQEMKKRTNFKTLGILAAQTCALKPMMDFCIEIPWAYDESVCQTRNISNFYYALTMLFAVYTQDEVLKESFSSFFSSQQIYLSRLQVDCQRIATLDWNNVTVLADGEACGIGCGGGLAFTEISILPGEYFNLLDYRHGPIVVADSKKLVIVLLHPEEETQQRKMISDLHAHDSFIITLGLKDQDFWGSNYHIALDSISRFPVWGLAFINLCQVLAFYKAVSMGHDPDVPQGLNPYVKL